MEILTFSTMSWIETYVVSPLVDVVTYRYARRPLSLQSSALLLAPLLCYYLTAILVILPRTFLLRLAILPITLFYTFRASIQLDITAGCGGDPRLIYLNQNFLVRNNFLALSHVWSSLFTIVVNDHPRYASYHMDIPTGPLRTYSQIQ